MKSRCFVAVDKDGTERITDSLLMRRTGIKAIMWGLSRVRRHTKNENYKWFNCWEIRCDQEDAALEFSGVILPKGSIEKLIGRKLTWKDEPVELS